MSIDICKDIDPKRANTEMIEAFARFIEDPNDKENKRNLSALYGHYSGSEDFVLYSPATSMAIRCLWSLFQCGEYEYYTIESCLKDAKEILQKLKEEKK